MNKFLAVIYVIFGYIAVLIGLLDCLIRSLFECRFFIFNGFFVEDLKHRYTNPKRLTLLDVHEVFYEYWYKQTQ